ncbi:MAG: Crp/Fnr family transcriptional regulator [Bacteroidia bacterium]|nr:Crp/Fnr family transcriptional regulator [Bacteroidia bacterium]
MIQKEILLSYGAVYKKYKQGEFIFMEGDNPEFYFEVVEGVVKMVNIHDSGKEFIQGSFSAGCSFGEPVLFVNRPYPASAVAQTDCVVLRIFKELLLRIMQDFPEQKDKFLKLFSERLYNKALIAREISGYNPEHRIMTVIEMFKNKHSDTNQPCKIDLTRQQIADMTGLRVETVIRTMKEMERKGIILIHQGKVFF